MEASPPKFILIADDDAQSAHALAKMLEADGYRTEVARDGAAAIGRLSREPLPDVLITEIHLPYSGGIAIGNYARARRPGIPIFVVTGHPESFAGKHQTLSKPVTLMPKPVDYADLLKRLPAAV